MQCSLVSKYYHIVYIIWYLLSVTAIVLTPQNVFGAGIQVSISNPIGPKNIPELVEKILRVAIQIGFPILVLAIVYTGFLFIKAQGNSTELQGARKAFTWTVIGGAILLGALAIAQLLQQTVAEIGAGI